MVHSPKRYLIGCLVVTLLLGAVPHVPASAAARGAARAEPPPGQPPGQVPIVQMFPRPGSAAASAGTEISFRGVTPPALGSIEVVGAVTGAHQGSFVGHSDGLGVSFRPAVPFSEGETVTVTAAGLDIGGNGESVSFSTAIAGPHAGVIIGEDLAGAGGPDPAVAHPLVLPGEHGFLSRPDLRPPVQTLRAGPGAVAGGLLFGSTNQSNNGQQQGAFITDNTGEVVWSRPATAPVIGDLKVVEYANQPALAFFEGGILSRGTFTGAWTVLDSSYRQIAHLEAANGMRADMHDLVLTPTSAVFLIYNPIVLDLTSLGGQRNALVYETVIQEVDLSSRAVLFEWHSTDDVPISESHAEVRGPLVDYMHGNSVDLDSSGDFYVSARHTNTVYKLDRQSGSVEWRLGGPASDFTFVNDPGFDVQHDARIHDNGTLSLFDNGIDAGRSRAVAYQLNLQDMTATRTYQLRFSPDILALTMGGTQELPNGNTLVSWGDQRRYTEYNAAGQMVLDVTMPGTSSYRIRRFDWAGHPTARPDAAALALPNGTVNVYASYNGSTETTAWRIAGGPDPNNLTTLRTVPKDGFETTVNIATSSCYFQVTALDGTGQELGTSTVVPCWLRAEVCWSQSEANALAFLAFWGYGMSLERFHLGAAAFLALLYGSRRPAPTVVEPLPVGDTCVSVPYGYYEKPVLDLLDAAYGTSTVDTLKYAAGLLFYLTVLGSISRV